MKGYRVGLIVNDLVCSRYVHDTIRVLGNEDDIELILILERDTDRSSGRLSRIVQNFRRNGVSNPMNFATFAALQIMERRFIYLLNGSVRKHFDKTRIKTDDFAKCVELRTPISRDTTVTCYNEEDLAQLQQLNLDIIVSGRENAVYGGKILSSSRLGIVSLQLGDNRGDGGMPPAFWEVYKRAPSTGFMIQNVGAGRDAGTVLHHGEVATQRTYTENLVHLYRESHPFLAFIVKQLLHRDESIKAVPRDPVAGTVHKYPNAWQTANYILKSFMLFADRSIEGRLLRKSQRWGVAYSRKFWADVTLSEGTRIPNPKYRFLADPFAIKKDGKHYIFVEDYDCRRMLGAVSCVVVNPDDNYEIVDNVLVEPFHLSFPFVFEESGEIFMVPETHQCNGIRLYRCIEFPNKWELDTELLSGVSAADTMLIKRRGKWFMLTNMNQFSSGDHSSQLHVFWSDKLRSSDWKPLSSLPVVNSSRIGRNAGLLLGKNGDWFRVRQRQAFNQYGAGFSIARITHLGLDGYSEESFARIDPLFFRDLKGTHHMHGVDDFTVYDFVKSERYS
ncbi:MAG: glucosamine inositolphosphorylceramide transferase family protein [Hyphomicrobiales bacterium]